MILSSILKGRTRLLVILLLETFLFQPSIKAEETGNRIPTVSLSEFVPEPQVKLHRTEIERARFPVVDVHSHFFVRFQHSTSSLASYVEVMDRNQIAVSISLDATLGPRLDSHLAYLWTDYKDRFVVFTNIDWDGSGGQTDTSAIQAPAFEKPDFVQNTIEQLRLAKAKGISGLKIFKQFGLGYQHSDGRYLAIDDERWNPIWEACGKLGMPVIMHTADPNAFFLPIDAKNERYEELSRRPQWSFYNQGKPSRSELHQARNRVFERNPGTTFIAAHFGNDAEDLAETARWIEKYPNLVVEFASRISELGRQPRASRKFFETYQDRILFGTDGPFPEERLRAYWRFLETADEYFPYSEKSPPPQGLWNISGLELSNQILRKVYFENASRLIPGVSEKLEKAKAKLNSPTPSSSK